MADAPDNRVTLLTPPGQAAIAVVRIAGPAVADFLREHFSKPTPPLKCVHGDLTDAGKVIDDALVVLGDGRADLNVHGGAWVVESVMALAQRFGFRRDDDVANSVDADDLLEREVLTWLPYARTELALRTLLAQHNAWEKLLGTADLHQRLPAILADHSLHWLLNLPRVAIVGAANVGKSTLANQLFAQERSITADLPGTTRDWVGEIANLDGLAVMLVDTPGLRPTDDPIERAAIEASHEPVRTADLTVVVLDATRELADQRHIPDSHPDALVVINKSDRHALWPPLPGAIQTVATTGHGIEDLRRASRSRFGCEMTRPDEPRWWTPRQREVIRRVLDGKAGLDALFTGGA